jgi:hypothetical protein
MNELLAMYAGVGAFLAIISLITLGFNIDSPKKLLAYEWLVLVGAVILFLVQKGLETL